MKNVPYKDDEEKWGKVVLRAQLWIAGIVFITEVVNNAILYFTRSQGYGPDTIVEKLIRYLLITTIVNFGLILIGQIYVRKTKDPDTRKFALMLCTTFICANVSCSHYQFASTLVIFVIPQMISILYEDISLSLGTLLISLAGQTIAIGCRAVDSLYNKDIGPEAAIAYACTISVYIFSILIHKTLKNRRTELGKALVQVEQANANVEKARFSLKMLETLARAIDAKDRYTNGHSMRVAAYSTILAENLGWDRERIEMLKFEALLHDIGKIGVPDTVLNKPDRLSDEEFNVIKSHTLVGADILKDMIAVPNADEVAKHHHERFDGFGYPSRLCGEEIPLNARIVCIADSFDAMSSDRIYRKALPDAIIREELVKGRGAQFDPELLDVFLQLFDEHKLTLSPTLIGLDEVRADQEYIIEDIHNVIRNVSNADAENNTYADFEKFYKYMRNIGIRYNSTIEVLSVRIGLKSEYDENSLSLEERSIASDALEIAIRKNIRAVDVYYKHSSLRHMVILLDAGKENMDIITNRISYDFKYNEKFNLIYEVNENIGALY